MNHGICSVPVSALRKDSSHKSEMVSQQLFGERCMVVDKANDHWIKVKTSYDGYEGWCQEGHVDLISEKDFEFKSAILTAEFVTDIEINGQLMRLPMGCYVDHLPDSTRQVIKRKLWTADKVFKDERTIRELSSRFLNTAYLWGGKSIFGIDCSGFTQTVFKFLDIPLLRDAYQQAEQGIEVSHLEEARCGDLAFFDNAEGRITHVGILFNNHEIIHSSVKVRIDKIDQQGIINKRTSERTHRLCRVKRYF